MYTKKKKIKGQHHNKLLLLHRHYHLPIHFFFSPSAMGVSNSITAVLNFIAFLCSIPIIAAGTWLASKPDNECIHAFRWPVVILGILILLVSLAGFVGAYWNKQGLLAFYLFCMAILIALLLILLVFAFVAFVSSCAPSASASRRRCRKVSPTSSGAMAMKNDRFPYFKIFFYKIPI